VKKVRSLATLSALFSAAAGLVVVVGNAFVWYIERSGRHTLTAADLFSTVPAAMLTGLFIGLSLAVTKPRWRALAACGRLTAALSLGGGWGGLLWAGFALITAEGSGQTQSSLIWFARTVVTYVLFGGASGALLGVLAHRFVSNFGAPPAPREAALTYRDPRAVIGQPDAPGLLMGSGSALHRGYRHIARRVEEALRPDKPR